MLFGGVCQVVNAQAPSGKKPNIIVIMGDDIGMWNIGAYHRGMMAAKDAEPGQASQRRHDVHGLLCGSNKNQQLIQKAVTKMFKQWPKS
jgi:hypothetical protein